MITDQHGIIQRVFKKYHTLIPSDMATVGDLQAELVKEIEKAFPVDESLETADEWHFSAEIRQKLLGKKEQQAEK